MLCEVRTNEQHAAELLDLDDAAFGAAVNDALHRPSPADAGQPPERGGAATPPPLATLAEGVRLIGRAAAAAAAQGGPGAAAAAGSPPRVGAAVGRRGAFPLKLQHATATASAPHRLALVGDAAHVIHPMAGQGLVNTTLSPNLLTLLRGSHADPVLQNLGMYDAAALVDALLSAAALGEDVGGAAALAAYERQRLPANSATAAGLHALQRLMISDDPMYDPRQTHPVSSAITLKCSRRSGWWLRDRSGCGRWTRRLCCSS